MKGNLFNFILKKNLAYCWMGKLSGKPVTPLHAYSIALTTWLRSCCIRKETFYFKQRQTNEWNAKPAAGRFRRKISTLFRLRNVAKFDSRPRRFARTGTDLPMDEREAGGGQGPRVQPLEEVLVGQVWTKEEDLNLVLYYVTNLMQ